MVDNRFFHNAGPFHLSDIIDTSGITTDNDTPAHDDPLFVNVMPLDRADAQHISFLDNPKYIDIFTQSKAGACFVREKFASRAPKGMRLLICDDPYRAYARVAQKFYPRTLHDIASIASSAHISESAIIGENVSIAHGCVIEDYVEIGDNVYIGANCVIQRGVHIDANTTIGALCTISHANIGAHCILHRGINIGQDGFGFSMGRDGHVKVPQLGRVIIGNHVEIGAGACIDRGTGPDTTIGNGTKIDNLVQIGHNVHIGQNAIIVAQVGIAGSTRIGDGAVIAGQAGIAGHLKVGAGARVAGQSGVTSDIPSGQAYGGYPAVPVKDWHRQTLSIAKLAKYRKKESSD